MSKIDNIKDTESLQDYLNNNHQRGNTLTKEREANSGYMGTLQAKKKVPQTSQVSDRYSKRSSQLKSSQSQKPEPKEALLGGRASSQVKKDDDDWETRSVRQELDYSKKDTAREIVAQMSENQRLRLRERILRDKQLGNRIGSSHSKQSAGSVHKSIGLKSRYSQASNKSRQQAMVSTAKDQDGRLTRIDEDGEAADGEGADVEKSKKQQYDEALMKAFNEIRAEKGLDPIDFNEDNDRLLQQCTDRLLESFKVATTE